MSEIILMLIWLGGTWVRIYKQARFFQIEEYMNGRYLRWVQSKPEHLYPKRALNTLIVSIPLIIILSEASGSQLPYIIAWIAALVIVWPPAEGEIKKAFRRTQRATRLLGAAFFVAVFDISLYVFIVSLFDIEADAWRAVALMLAGLLAFITAPLMLVMGNILMQPVEGFMRARFIARAKDVMQSIQPTVVGITGSYGKTTTKNFIADILNGRFRAYATPKSYNTMMGVCLAINNDLKDDYSIDYFIVEMGAYIEGEIKAICDLTPPSVAVVVEVGPQHLERFGTLESIVEAKYEIIKALPPDGVGVFNWDNPYVRGMMQRGYPQTRLGVSKEVSPENADGPRFIATDIETSLGGLKFTVHDVETGQQEQFITSVLGEHNVTNILLAVAVAVQAGMSLQDVAFRVRVLRPVESRLVTLVDERGITIINDAYSANPAGVLSSLKVLGMHDKGRRLVVTPGMVELGPLHETENHKLGMMIPTYATDVILVGAEQTRPIKEGLTAAGFDAQRLQVVDEVRQAMAWYQANLAAGDSVLFLNDLPDTY